MKYSVELIKTGCIVQYIWKNKIYATCDHLGWCSKDQGRSWEKIFSLPSASNGLISNCRNFILRSRLIRKLRKNIGINNLIVLNSGTIIIQYDKIYRLEASSDQPVPVFNLTDQNIAGPLKNGMCYSPKSDSLYFGEYTCTSNKAIRIFRGENDGRDWQECYRFPPGRVRHIHSVNIDSFRNCIWVCTGDSDEQSGLFLSRDRCSTLKCIGTGDQTWRMVSLIITEFFLYWGTDAGQDAAPGTNNYIYQFDPETKLRTKLSVLDNPAYYSISLTSSGMFIGTTFEPGLPENNPKQAALWHSKDGKRWEKILSFPFKKISRSAGTRYATVLLPGTDQSLQEIYFSLLNVKDNEFSLLKLNSRSYEQTK
jgi:hypothetical protein